jgi:formylglycine-generating enzyme required for sulfatase activity
VLRQSVLLILLSNLLAFSQEPARASRFAVLIGNSRYSHLPPLTSVGEDLKAIQGALKDAGFQVKVIEDTDYQTLFDGVVAGRYFTEIRPGDVCFFYYAGYAVQYKDDNYLVPRDFDSKAPEGFNYGALSLSRVLEVLESKNPRIKIIALDAATNMEDLAAIEGVGRGLGFPDLSDNKQTMVAFSTTPNEPAVYPASGAATPFTKYLAAAIAKAGLTIEEVFNDAKREVIKNTTERQQPYPYSNITQLFYFHDPLPVKAELPAGVPKRNRKDRQEYVWIPPGKFLMGCVPSDTKCDDDEKPQHTVTISKGFWMGGTEVTVDAYRRYFENNFDKKHKMPEAPDWDRKWSIILAPINAVTWQQAKSYCEWVGGRLPSEAEWEYAARAGADNEIYPLNSENSRDKANFLGKKGNDRYDFTAPVGSFDRNAFGLFDMSGNVWEWVNDWYSKTYYSESPATDPKGPASGTKHIIRGGSWNSDPAKHLRISLRKANNDWGNALGFRCLLEDTPATKELLQ